MSSFKLQQPIVHKPSIQLKEVTSQELRQVLETWTWQKLKMTDNFYFIPTLWEDWDKIFQYLFPLLPKYAPDKFDCENFAGYLRVMAAKEFGVNVVGDAEGYADFQDGKGPQRHGWTVFTDGQGLYQVESQKLIGSSIMDIGDPLYVPDELVMG